MGILTGILLLSVIMILHEIGHFATGRKLGFKVEEFFLFMGPRLLFARINGTRYSLNSFRSGASCRLRRRRRRGGGQEAEIRVPRARFFDRPRWARAIVLTAGAAMNYLSGVLVFFLLFAWFGFATNTVALIGTGSQAEAAGLGAGDRVLAVDGARVGTQLDFVSHVMFLPPEKPVVLTVETAETGEKRDVGLTPVKTSAFRLGVTVDLSGDQPVIMEVDPSSNGNNPVLQKGDVLVSVNGV